MQIEQIELDSPQPKQIQFLLSKARIVGFGGARGGGKSWAVRFKAILLCCNHPGIKVLIVRQTYPELTENHIIPLRNLTWNCATYVDKDKKLTFDNGSIIKFMYCKADSDLTVLQGQEYDVIFIDEATNLSEYQIKSIYACNRGTNNFPKRMYLTCNPLGQGHNYIKRIFIDKTYTKGENPDDYEFIKSLATDNLELMRSQPEYIQMLESLPPKLRSAWLEGDWNIAGGFFDDFRIEPDVQLCIENNIDIDEAKRQRRFCHVIKPFDIPSDWNIYRSFDWGYAKPFSSGWWAVDPDGVIYRILEFYGCTEEADTGLRWTPEQVFKEIKNIENTHPWLKGKDIQGVADSAIWDAQTGKSINEVANDCGIYFGWKSDKNRIAGWMQCHYRLQFDHNGKPMMYVFENCKDFIRTIPVLQYDEHKVEDLDTKLEDHIADEWRYFCMTRPIKPVIKPKESQYKNSRIYQALDIPEEDLAEVGEEMPTIQVKQI